jgi:hypothetical protein
VVAASEVATREPAVVTAAVMTAAVMTAAHGVFAMVTAVDGPPGGGISLPGRHPACANVDRHE